jgi:DNA-binding response OmpR family regulator
LKIAENVKKNKIPLPIVILSAKNNGEDINRAIKLGVKDYFVKPFSFSDLLEKVKTIMQPA